MLRKKLSSGFLSLLFLFFLSLFIIPSVFSASISALNPDTGSPGSVITITGDGFSSTGNTVYFRSTETTSLFNVEDVDSPDGSTISFTIPTYLRLACSFDDPPCAAPYVQVSAGVFDVYVITPDLAESNRLSFTVPNTQTLGDVNDDGLIDIVDALLVSQKYVGLETSVFISDAADVDGNGTI
ncbi:MAG: IPT/TIG domain-containing protein, partial [Spirochaetales bacterium]|nr:IPT/TIG domain-containing protein [Spirochaetales bacterium]